MSGRIWLAKSVRNKSVIYRAEPCCRGCGGNQLELIMSFGRSPLADRLLTADQLAVPEPRAPLNLVFCNDCALVQITETVAPEILFHKEYPYFSSVSPALLQHFARSARELINTRDLNANSLVVEAASNDGYMLKNFVAKGIPVLGIDPAPEPVKVAQKAGIPTICTFFSTILA